MRCARRTAPCSDSRPPDGRRPIAARRVPVRGRRLTRRNVVRCPREARRWIAHRDRAVHRGAAHGVPQRGRRWNAVPRTAPRTGRAGRARRGPARSRRFGRPVGRAGGPRRDRGGVAPHGVVRRGVRRVRRARRCASPRPRRSPPSPHRRSPTRWRGRCSTTRSPRCERRARTRWGYAAIRAVGSGSSARRRSTPSRRCARRPPRPSLP